MVCGKVFRHRVCGTLLAALVACAGVSAAQGQRAPRGAQGAAAFRVVLPDAPKPWEKTAAAELEHYLAYCLGENQLTVDGADGILFHVGDTPFARTLPDCTYQDEEWRIKSKGRHVALVGGGTRGTLYAVYHFLEDLCGVRWWMDGDEDVPAPRPLRFAALDRRGRPFFACRNIFRWRTSDPRTAVRNRLNDNGDSPIPLSLGGSFTYGPPHVAHTWERYFPFKKFGKEHPEWYSLWEGERFGDNGKGQLCLTCPGLPDVLAGFIEESIAKGEAHAAEKGLSKPRIYDISQNDSTMRFCKCPSCLAERAKYGHAGLMLKFVNASVEKAVKAHPELLFSTLAYQLTEPVPKNGVVAADNVIVRLCNTRQNMAAGIREPDNKFMHDQVIAWKGYTRHLYIWEYGITYGDMGKGLPFANEFYIPEKYRFYADNSVKGFLLEHEHFETSDMYELKFYLERKMLEDPYQKTDGLIEDFMARYYGAAGGKILEARKLLDRRRREKKAFIRWFPSMGEYGFFSDGDLAEVKRLFNEAAEAVKGDGKREERVARAYLGFGRLADFRSRFGTKHPPEKGVSEKPFFDFPLDDHIVKPNPRRRIDLVKDTEIGDPLAGGNLVARIKMNDKDMDGRCGLPFEIGTWDTVADKSILRKKWDRPLGEGYHWYNAGRVKLPAGGFCTYVSCKNKWSVKVNACLPEMNGNEFEVKALVKFTGPKFFPGSQAPNEVRVARLAYVDP